MSPEREADFGGKMKSDCTEKEKTDLQRAVAALKQGHTIAFCKNREIITSDERGIAPTLTLLRQGKDLRGYSVADKIVGRAAAMLFVKAGIVSVYAVTLSQGAKALLESHKIPTQYETLTQKIINRRGDGICPMEKAVEDIGDDEIDAGAEKLMQL